MRLNKKRNLEYYTFSNFDQHLRHGIFTRKGGISPTPWEALNVGSTVGDEPDRVLQNRSSLFETLELDISRVYECWQVHGTKVILAEGPREYINPLKKADAIITNKQGLSLLMRFADCVPILLFDRKLKVIGIIHAGWKGTVNNIAEVAVKSMVHAYGSNPKDIIAGIGPSIGPDHYEVGEDVIKKVESVY